MPGGEDRGHPRGDLAVTVGRPPGDRRIVEVDPDDAVSLQPRRVRAKSMIKLPALNMDGGVPPRKVAQPAGMVVVQVRDGNRVDLVEREPDTSQFALQRVAGAGREPYLHAGVLVEPTAQGRVPDESRVEPGVDQ